MLNMTKYIRLDNENGRLELNNLKDIIYPDVSSIELHLGSTSSITASEWLDLADSLPALSNVYVLNKNGDKHTKTTIKDVKIFNIIKRLQDLSREINQQNNELLSESLNKYRDAISGVLGEDQSQQCLVEIEEHLNMTLSLLTSSKTFTPKSPAELKTYLERTDGIFANRSNKQWYIDAKRISMTLVAGASLALIAGLLISSATPTLPFMAINYIVSGNVMPIAATAIIGLFVTSYASSQAEKCSQQDKIDFQSKVVVSAVSPHFFSPAKQPENIIISAANDKNIKEPSAPPSYDDFDCYKAPSY